MTGTKKKGQHLWVKRWGIVSLCMAVGCVTASVAFGQANTDPPAKLSPQQRRELTDLMAAFRRARRKPEQRAEMVQQTLELGPRAATALSANIGREIYPQLKHYRSAFYQRAVTLYKKRILGATVEEISELRRKVLSLKERANLTKQAIIQEGDPAVGRLQEILVVSPANVLAESESLQAERGQLFKLGRLWQQCEVYLYERLPNDENRPPQAPRFEDYLRGEEELAVGLAAPMSPQTRNVLNANARLASRLDPEEARAVLALNLTRNLLGLESLLIDLQLTAAARDHSKDMATHQFFAHESPVQGKKTPWDRARNFGTKASGENIAMGVRDGEKANRMWFHSPGHHKNMLGNHRRVGMGRSSHYFTELFGK